MQNSASTEKKINMVTGDMVTDIDALLISLGLTRVPRKRPCSDTIRRSIKQISHFRSGRPHRNPSGAGHLETQGLFLRSSAPQLTPTRTNANGCARAPAPNPGQYETFTDEVTGPACKPANSSASDETR